MEPDVKLLKDIVEAVVSKPEAVKVERKVDEMGVLLELSIDAADMGHHHWQGRQNGKSSSNDFASVWRKEPGKN